MGCFIGGWQRTPHEDCLSFTKQSQGYAGGIKDAGGRGHTTKFELCQLRLLKDRQHSHPISGKNLHDKIHLEFEFLSQ